MTAVCILNMKQFHVTDMHLVVKPTIASLRSSSRPGLHRAKTLRARASSGGDGKSGESVDEVVARLAAAEAEAAELRAMLTQAKGDDAPAATEALPKKTPQYADERIDGTGFRETIWGVKKGSGETVKTGTSWLQEGDASFFTGDGPSELADGMKMTEEDKATVTRRLIGGLAATGVLFALSLIPDKEVRPKPAKPLFFYIVPLLRIQRVLEDMETTVRSGDAVALRAQIKTVVSNPFNAKENLKNAALCLESDVSYDKANKIAVDFLEYMEQVDYSKYFESVTAVNERQINFSTQSVQAAERKLKEFLALMPADQLEAATTQLNVQF
eukprot:CAMPEP_0114257448 /NCGR_PEP_ID=MMETSP0058-20121206/18738_1 /TAXON_ID=36894 /ORGANISM="Pyramimonas parkeae, CCMP726" /LENGTH=327 /DNA_ID=CAMNT_0001372175 /DNA_START=36 /DNA_END=1019 /DNA_ORIENTATION=+